MIRLLVYNGTSAGSACEKGSPMSRRLDPGSAHLSVQSAVKLQAPNVDLQPAMMRVAVRNGGDEAVSGVGAFPISLDFKLMDEKTQVVDPYWIRWPLPCELSPGDACGAVDLPSLLAGNGRPESTVQEGIPLCSPGCCESRCERRRSQNPTILTVNFAHRVTADVIDKDHGKPDCAIIRI